MVKRAQKPKKKAESSTEMVDSSSNESKDLVAKAKSILATSLEDLEAGLKRLGEKLREASKKKDAEHDRDGWSNHAWLTKQVASVAGEVRKLDAADRNVAKQLSPQLVMAYFRAIDSELRQRLVRQVVALDDEGSVLG